MRQVESTNRKLLSSTRTLAVCVAAIAAISGGQVIPRAYAYLARPEGAQRTPEQVARLMLRLGNTYQGPSAVSVYPSFRDRVIPRASTRGQIHRKVWQGTINVSGQLLEIVLNDKSGRLMCAFNTGEPATEVDCGRIVAPIDTANQAANISIEAVRRLLSVAPHALAALDGKPRCISQNSYWRVAWKVRNGPGSQAYPLVVFLSRKDGRLISIANGEELDQSTDH